MCFQTPSSPSRASHVPLVGERRWGPSQEPAQHSTHSTRDKECLCTSESWSTVVLLRAPTPSPITHTHTQTQPHRHAHTDTHTQKRTHAFRYACLDIHPTGSQTYTNASTCIDDTHSSGTSTHTHVKTYTHMCKYASRTEDPPHEVIGHRRQVVRLLQRRNMIVETITQN